MPTYDVVSPDGESHHLIGVPDAAVLSPEGKWVSAGGGPATVRDGDVVSTPDRVRHPLLRPHDPAEAAESDEDTADPSGPDATDQDPDAGAATAEELA
jgi:hypothetical protein